MNNNWLLAIAIPILFTLPFCTSNKMATIVETKQTIGSKYSFDNDIKPIMLAKCAPCHVGKSKEEAYDNYQSTKQDIGIILERVNKNPSERGFMPKRKEKLPDSLIAVIKEWRNEGMREK